MAVAVSLSALATPVAPQVAVAAAQPAPAPAPVTSPEPLVYALQNITLALKGPAGTQSSIKPVYIDVTATGVTQLGSWEFELGFDPSFVDVISTSMGSAFGGGEGCNPAVTRCAFALGPWTDGSAADIGGLSYWAGPAMSANGLVARIALQPRGKAGVTSLTLTRTLATNQAGEAQNALGQSTVITFGAPASRTFLPVAWRSGSILSGPEADQKDGSVKSEAGTSTPARVSAPAEMINRQRPGTCLPAAPNFGEPVSDPEAAYVNLYRKFGTLTAYNLLDAVDDDMCSANGPECTEAEISVWVAANANSSGVAAGRSALLRSVLATSPLQLKYIRGGVSIAGIRDNSGKLIGGKVGLLQIGTDLTVFNRNTAKSANSAGTTPMFDALVDLTIDTINNSFKIGVQGIDIKLVGNTATMNLDLDVYMGAPNGYGARGSIELLNLHLELMTINEADADFGFTLKNGALDELYLGVTFNANVQTGAFGSILVGGQFLVGRLDPSHPTLQEDFGDLFKEMDVSPGKVIEGLYLSVYANNIPIVSIGGCLVAELGGGGGLAFWVFTDPAQNDTAWGTRVSGFVQGKGGACLVALAVNIDLTLANGFGEDETKITGDLFVAGGCGFCEPEEWITEAGYENDKGCIKCGLTLGFIIPLDGNPAPYMNPEPQFSCSL